MKHYINLSRGVYCPHFDVLWNRETPYNWVRIQSTQCEQKLWAEILRTLGPQFYMDAAQGTTIVLHDQSEKNRETRAMRQGLSWIRYALDATWFGKETQSFVRGHDVTAYWRHTYRNLSKSDRAQLKFYRDFASPFVSSVSLESCWQKPLHSVV